MSEDKEWKQWQRRNRQETRNKTGGIRDEFRNETGETRDGNHETQTSVQLTT